MAKPLLCPQCGAARLVCKQVKVGLFEEKCSNTSCSFKKLSNNPPDIDSKEPTGNDYEKKAA